MTTSTMVSTRASASASTCTLCGALIAREAAGHAADAVGERAREAELAWEADWLAERLGLA